MDEVKNSVKYLQQICFANLERQEKLVIKSLGRLTPDLIINRVSKSRKVNYERRFNSKYYNQHDWLTGCPEKNAFFCFPCLLYGNEYLWTKLGVTDINHLTSILYKHERNSVHLRSVCKLGLLGTADINTGAYIGRQEINKHNEKVRRNREVLSKILDCLVFCGKFELPMRGYGETEHSTNSEVFIGLMEFCGKLDDHLKNHFLNSTMFKESAVKIQNELLECIVSVCKEEICKQIQKAKYIAVMTDDTSDISEHVQQVIVFRYELQGKVYERFWGLFILKSQDAEGLAECILEQLKSVLDDENERLIAQTYDGAATIIGETGGVHTIIKKSYKNAHFIHCYTHQLHSIIEKAASQSSQVRIFFSSLATIPAYFNQSPSHLAELEEVSKQFPLGSSVDWDFGSGIINTVFYNRDILIQCCKSLKSNINMATVQGAAGLLRTLTDDDFNFWLKFFNEIIPHVDILYSILQNRLYNSTYLSDSVKEFAQIIDEKRNNIPATNGEYLPGGSRAKFAKECNNVVAARGLCDYITFQIKERLSFTKHLSAAKLLNFCIYQGDPLNVPSLELDETVEAYPILDKDGLHTELCVLYEQPELKNLSGHVQIYDIMNNTSIFRNFTEVFNLIQMVITTPMPTTEPKRCVSTLKRINAFLRNSKGPNQLTAFAMLSIEKNMIANITNFHNMLIMSGPLLFQLHLAGMRSKDRRDRKEECYDLEKFLSKLKWLLDYKPQRSNELEVKFYHYNKRIFSPILLNSINETSLPTIDYYPSRPTVFIVHGFMSHGNAQWVIDMATAFILRYDVHVIAVDWSQAFSSWKYWNAVANTRTVGSEIAR
ncbi:zinc finger MYM-type protein 1-like [Arctopsyche grandis]|uniref:zinc finger MYM-type protein 1-like n=1 Tax=Arctopsyche grandis TaxID=121162 RepID=UPI00406D8360